MTTGGQLNATMPMMRVVPPNPRDGYVATANDFLRGVQVLASGPSSGGLSMALLAGQSLECALKGFLTHKGVAHAALSEQTTRHNLSALWTMAAAHGLAVEPGPPEWCRVIDGGHDSPYRTRYLSDVHGSAGVAGEHLACELGKVVTLVTTFIHETWTWPETGTKAMRGLPTDSAENLLLAVERKVEIAELRGDELRKALAHAKPYDGPPPLDVQAAFEAVVMSASTAIEYVLKAAWLQRGSDSSGLMQYKARNRAATYLQAAVQELRNWDAPGLRRDLQAVRNDLAHNTYEKGSHEAGWDVGKPAESQYQGQRGLLPYAVAATALANSMLTELGSIAQAIGVALPLVEAKK